MDAQVTPESMHPLTSDEVEIRSARPESDLASILSLHATGLISGDHADNDTVMDLDRLVEAYFNDGGMSHFWVAALRDDPERLIGMVGVQRAGDDMAEIRRLRVSPQFRKRGLGSMLVECALTFCKERGYLKVVLDTRIERSPAIQLFQQFGFKLNRGRSVQGKMILDFYLDLYSDFNGQQER